MEKGFVVGAIVLIVLVLLGVIFYPNSQDTLELSQEQILEVIKPEIKSYCQTLDDEAVYSHCVICGGSYSGELEDKNYVYVESFQDGGYGGYKYMIEDKGEYYLVTSQIHRIAGRNDRPASASELIFRIDKEGKILESDIPEISECALQ